MPYQTMKEAKMRHVMTFRNREHILQSIDGDSMVEGFIPYFEVWAPSKNHASYGIKYKNTHLEFCYTLPVHVAHVLGLLKNY